MQDSKRDKILAAATQVFAEKGYQYATISDIAKSTGMSTGLLYSYFENKLDLLLSIILIFLENANELNLERVEVLRDPFDKLHAFLHNCEDLLLRDDKALCRVKVLHEALPHLVMIKAPKLKKKRDEIMAANQQLIQTLDTIMKEGQQQGVFDDTLEPAVLRQVLAGTIERIIYGLFFNTFSGETIGYDRPEGHRAMVHLIEKFIRK